MTKRAGCMWFQMDPNTEDKRVVELIQKFLNDNKKEIPGGYLYILDSLDEAQVLIKRMEKALALGKNIQFTKDGEMILNKEDLKKLQYEEDNKEDF
jgi:hypothetical protein